MIETEDALDSRFEWFEQKLNIAGYFPIVSTISGGIRICFGKLELIGAIVTSAFMAIKALFNPDVAERRQELDKAGHVFVKYAMHGGANILRGSLEMILFLSLVTCLPYDLRGNRFAYVRQSSDRPGFYYIHQFSMR